jgi:MFS family permease
MANPFQKNIRIIFFVRFCYALIFSISVITLYWKKYGLNLLDIFWLQAIFALAVVVFEIPTGLVADKLGRKKTLILSSAIAAGAWVIYVPS